MAVSRAYLDYVLGQLAGLGSVRSRRMFGGAGLYCDEIFFAIIADDTLYLRVDDASRSDYTTRGMAAFRPYAERPEVSMSYFAAPADVLETPEELLIWSRRSVSAAGSSKPAANPKRRRRRKA